MQKRNRLLALWAGFVLLMLPLALLNFTPNTVHAASPAPQLHVSGTSIRDALGNRVFLHGVDQSGAEYMCINNRGIFDAPANQTMVSALVASDVNAVRILLNEDCWLRINGVLDAYSGPNYATAIVKFANLLVANGITPEIVLQWSAPGTIAAHNIASMPDEDHSVTFWRSVARWFGGRRDVILDLHTEPHPGSWYTWQHGGWSNGFNNAGMQQLVTTVRQYFPGVIQLAGISWANSLGGASGWITHEPYDPYHNLVAVVHDYIGNGNQTPTEWSANYGATMAKVPLIVGEFGAYKYDGSGSLNTSWGTSLMNWVESSGGDGMFGWTWNPWGNLEALITNYSTPTLTSWGQLVVNYYKAHHPKPQPTPTPTSTATFTPTSTATLPPTATPTPSPTPTPTPPPSGWTTIVDDEFTSAGIPSHWELYDGHYNSGPPDNCATPSQDTAPGDGYMYLTMAYKTSGTCGAGWYEGGMMISSAYEETQQSISVRWRIIPSADPTIVRSHEIIPMIFPEFASYADAEDDLCETGQLTGCQTYLHYSGGSQLEHDYVLDMTQWHTWTFTQKAGVITTTIDGVLVWSQDVGTTILPDDIRRAVLQQECPGAACPPNTQPYISETEVIQIDWFTLSVPQP